MKDYKIIRKWSKLRRVPKEPWQRLAQVAQQFYDTLSKVEQKKMILEFTEYIRAVHDKEILPGPFIKD